MHIKFVVNEMFDGGSVRDFLKTGKGLSSRLFSCLKREKGILLNGKTAQAFEKVVAGDAVELVFPEGKSEIVAEYEPIEIVFEDECFLAVNKPALMPCHPSVGHYTGTLANCVQGYFEQMGIKTAVRIPARIDSGTTGIVIIAKNEYAAEKLASGTVKKTYLCVCEGNVPEKGEINLPIARAEGSILKRCVSAEGKPARTFYEKVGGTGKWSALRVWIETGRTHQIRVHMSEIGYPLVGDWLYGTETTEFSRHLLHLAEVEFIHPVTDEKITLSAPLPEDMKRFFYNKNRL